MTSLIKAADTRFAHPVFSEWNPLSTQGGTGGRLMSDMPHTDGLLMATGFEVSSANLVRTRNGTDDWSYNRTAAGAETYYARVALGAMQMIRTGETQIIDDVSEGPSMPDKGISVQDVFVIWNVGVVALTSATLRLAKGQYPLPGAAAAAVVGTDILAATAVPTLTTQAANAYLTQLLAVASPVFNKSNLAEYELELNFVMANTGTIQLAALGCHFNFNYN